MKVKNISGHDRFIPDPDGGEDIACPAGDSVEVSDELGASLCEQVDVWAPAAKPKAEKTDKAAPSGEEG